MGVTMLIPSPRLLLLLFFFLPLGLFAQSLGGELSSSATDPDSLYPVDTPTKTPSSRYHELSIYSGQSFGYPMIMSNLKDQRLFVIGVRYTQFWHAFRHMNLNWNADIKPLALYSNDIYGPREYTYGGGITFGAQWVPHTHWRCQPVFDTDGGMIAFTKDTPVPDSRRVNLTFDFGPGLYIPMNEGRAIKVGAWFYHFSDAFTAPRNPNMDTFLVYAGFTFRNFPSFSHR